MERENRFYVGLKKFLLIVGILILLYLLNTWQWGELKDISLILKNAKLQLFSIIFLAILLEAIPFLLLGTLVSGTIEVLVPQKRLERFIPANRFLAPLSGLFLGLVFPVCSCGSVPVARRLIKKNLPLSGALSYMLAAPIINPIVIFSTAIAFNGSGKAIGGRIVLASSIAFLAAILMSKGVKGKDVLKDIPEDFSEINHNSSSPSKIQKIFQHAEKDFLEMSKYLIFGAFLAALFQTLISRPAILKMAGNHFSSIGVMESLAILLSLCSIADAFVAATFTQFPMSSKLAFLIAGPMVSLSLLTMYLGVFKKRFVVKIFLFVSISIFIITYLLNLTGR